MISGALFLDPEHDFDLKVFLKKNVFRILLAILTVGFVFALMEQVYTHKTINFGIILTAVKNNLCGNNWDHLWYLYMILGLYLMTPMFRCFTINASDTVLKFTVGVIFVYACVLKTIGLFLENFGGREHFIFKTFTVESFLFGYLLHKEKIRFKRSTSILLILGVVCYMVICSSSEKTYWLLGDDAIKGMLPGMMLSVGIFTFVKSFKSIRAGRFIKMLSSLSFGIYLFHELFLNLFYKVIRIESLINNEVIVWIVAFAGTLILSALLTYVARLIKPIKKYIL